MKRVIYALLTLALAGCGVFSPSTPQPLPTVMLGEGSTVNAPEAATPPAGASSGGGDVVASGVVAVGQEAVLAFAGAARVHSVNVKPGDRVTRGQVLAQLTGTERLVAALEAAKFELLAAQQARDALLESAPQAYAQAYLRLANARDALDQAEKRRGWKEYRVGSENQIELARADLILAEDNLKRVQEVYGSAASSENDDLNKAAAITAISAARTVYDKAVANLNYLLSMPNSIEVDKAEAGLQAARAEVDAAQRELEKWQDGPDPAQLSLAEARIDNAQAQAAAAQAALADLALVAPFDGTLIDLNVHPGEWALPGQPVMRIADLDHLRVETTDLSERYIARISIGQQALVYIKALNLEVTGKVSQVASLADTLGGDVVYRTTIELDSQPPGLRPGMSVEVQFKP